MSNRLFNRILVTGAAGFIGFHLARRLCRDGLTVHGIDNLNPYYDPQLKRDRLAQMRGYEGFTFAQHDIADRPAMEETFRAFKPDAVVHLAAQAGVRHGIDHPHDYIDSNITGFLNILEGCRHVGAGHLVFASSSSVYGGNVKLPFEENDPVDHPVSLYAATKKSNELMAHAYAHLFGFPCTGLRFFTVYGPWGRPDMAVFKFTDAILNGRAIDVYNNGDMGRDFTYIDDIVEGVVRTLQIPPVREEGRAPYRLYNIGNNEPVNLLAMIEMLENEIDKKAIKNMLPMQPGDVPATYAAIDALYRVTGFRPSTPLSQGLAAFVRWYRDYYAGQKV